MNNFNQALVQLLYNPWFVWIFLIWVFFWKGRALWKASQKKHLVWFVILLLVNTMGLLEIAYIFFLNRWSIDGGKILAFLEKKLKIHKKKK